MAANQQAHLDINQQTSSSYGFGQQQKTQASKEARTDLSKLPSVTHVSLPSAGENNQSLNSGIPDSFCHLVSNSHNVFLCRPSEGGSS